MSAVALRLRPTLRAALMGLLLAVPLSLGAQGAMAAVQGQGPPTGDPGPTVFYVGYLSVGLPDEDGGGVEATPLVMMRPSGDDGRPDPSSASSSATYNCRGTSPVEADREPFTCDSFVNPGKGTRIAVGIYATAYAGLVRGVVVPSNNTTKVAASASCQFGVMSCTTVGYTTPAPKFEPGYLIRSTSSGAGFYWIRVEVG